MQDDYGNGRTLRPSTWRKVMKEVRDPEYDVKYMIVGTVDMSAGHTHPSGKPMVYATVSASIYSTKGKLPKFVVALRSIREKGIGADQNLAKKNALKAVAERACDEIIDKLRLQGLL